MREIILKLIDVQISQIVRGFDLSKEELENQAKLEVKRFRSGLSKESEYSLQFFTIMELVEIKQQLN